MEYNGYNTEDKAQRRRVMIITTAIAAIVLGIAAWAIIAIISGSEQKIAQENAEIVNVDDSQEKQEHTVEEEPSEAPETEGVSNAEETEEVAVVEAEEETAEAAEMPAEEAPATENMATIYAQEEVPETGPEEVLPLALLIGAVVMFMSSKQLAKREVVA